MKLFYINSKGEKKIKSFAVDNLLIFPEDKKSPKNATKEKLKELDNEITKIFVSAVFALVNFPIVSFVFSQKEENYFNISVYLRSFSKFAYTNERNPAISDRM